MTSCSFSASITSDEAPSNPVVIEKRPLAGFLNGEMVTTPHGYKIKTVFGDVTDRKNLANGYKLKGAVTYGQ